MRKPSSHRAVRPRRGAAGARARHCSITISERFRDHARVAVVVAHEALDGQPDVVVGIAEGRAPSAPGCSKLELVELAAGLEVELVAHAPEEVERVAQLGAPRPP